MGEVGGLKTHLAQNKRSTKICLISAEPLSLQRLLSHTMLFFILSAFLASVAAEIPDTTSSVCPVVQIEAVRLPDLNVPSADHSPHYEITRYAQDPSITQEFTISNDVKK